MDTLEQIKRGEEAERLMNHPLMVDAFTQVKDGILTAMANSALGDEKTHNKLVIAMQLLEKIRSGIEEVATTGKLAKHQYERDNVIKKLARAATKR